MNARVEDVKALLREHEVVCSLKDFYQTGKPNRRNAVSTLRASGWVIETAVARFAECGEDAPVHAHHRLARDPEQLTLMRTA